MFSYDRSGKTYEKDTLDLVRLHMDYFFERILPILNSLVRNMQYQAEAAPFQDNVSLSEKSQESLRKRLNEYEGEIRSLIIYYYEIVEVLFKDSGLLKPLDPKTLKDAKIIFQIDRKPPEELPRN